MSTVAGVRRLLLDEAPGELRGVVLLDGRPERLLLERDGEAPGAALTSRFVGRVVTLAVDRAFVELPTGPAGVMRLADPRPAEGAAVEVEVVAEAYGDKGPRLVLLRPGEGPPRALRPAEPIASRLTAFAPDAPLELGDAAREAADLAQDAALEVCHGFRGGLRLAVEPTRALVAIDVDLAAGIAAGERRLREANLSAVRQAVRLLRLKSLAGSAVIDLIGFPPSDIHGLLRAEALRALVPDGGEARVSGPDRFGLLALSRPRRERPIAAVLLDGEGRPTTRTQAQALVREAERAARADPGSRWTLVVAADVAEAVAPLLRELGPRFSVALAKVGEAAYIRPA